MLNEANLIGHLGADPETRNTQRGDKVCTFTMATSERWKDKASGERKEHTEWHRVVIWNQGLVDVAGQYLRKGSKVYISGKLQTRKWEKDGVERYTTEIVLGPFNGKLVMLDGKPRDDGPGDGGGGTRRTGNSSQPARSAGRDNLDDDIPF